MDFAMELPISSLSSHLTTLIRYLLKNKQGTGTIIDESSDEVGMRVYDFATGRPCIDYCTSLSSGNKDVADRFKLRIPFAGKQIIWELIFNSLSPEDPPDFNLNDENFMRSVDADCLEKFVPSLINWNYNDPSSLKNVITEFISLYKKYQFEQLKKDNYCWFEYLSVMKTNLINENDIEVLVSNTGLVHFLIRLCPDLIDYKMPHSHEHYAALIFVCFSSSNSGNKMVKPQLKFTSSLRDCFVPKPAGDSLDSPTLAEYLIKLNERIEDSLAPGLLKPVAKRKRFIFEWLGCCGRRIIEFDAIKFHSASFLFEQEGFSYILLISLPKDFTASPPEYKFQSVYSQTPLVIPINPVPYSPNWPFKIMMMRAINFIETKIATFRKICVDRM